jgi:hypothetical protein
MSHGRRILPRRSRRSGRENKGAAVLCGGVADELDELDAEAEASELDCELDCVLDADAPLGRGRPQFSGSSGQVGPEELLGAPEEEAVELLEL